MARRKQDIPDVVTFQEAEKLLDIRPRRREQLIEAGELQVLGSGHKRKVTLESIVHYAGWSDVESYRRWQQGLTFREAEARLRIGSKQRQNLIRDGRLQVVGRGRRRRVTSQSVRRYDEQRRRARRARYGWGEQTRRAGQAVSFEQAEKILDIGPRQRQVLARVGKLQVVDGRVTLKSVRRRAGKMRNKAN